MKAILVFVPKDPVINYAFMIERWAHQVDWSGLGFWIIMMIILLFALYCLHLGGKALK